MRFTIFAFALAAILLPQSASATNPAQCQRLDRQIMHHQTMAERADELGKDDWAEKTQRHVNLLMTTRRDAGCPEPVKDSGMAKAFTQILRLAGSAAITYFTFGAF
jgi:hypothetical protein